MKSTLSLLLALAASALAGSITLNTPTTAWTAGTGNTASWTYDASGSGGLTSTSTGQLQLIQQTKTDGTGTDTVINYLGTISAASGSINVNPSVGGTLFALKFVPTDSSASVKYSGAFSITGGTTTTTTPTSTKTSTSTSSSTTATGTAKATTISSNAQSAALMVVPAIVAGAFMLY